MKCVKCYACLYKTWILWTGCISDFGKSVTALESFYNNLSWKYRNKSRFPQITPRFCWQLGSLHIVPIQMRFHIVSVLLSSQKQIHDVFSCYTWRRSSAPYFNTWNHDCWRILLLYFIYGLGIDFFHHDAYNDSLVKRWKGLTWAAFLFFFFSLLLLSVQTTSRFMLNS